MKRLSLLLLFFLMTGYTVIPSVAQPVKGGASLQKYAPEAAEFMGSDPAQLRSWHHDGLISIRGWNSVLLSGTWEWTDNAGGNPSTSAVDPASRYSMTLRRRMPAGNLLNEITGRAEPVDPVLMPQQNAFHSINRRPVNPDNNGDDTDWQPWLVVGLGMAAVAGLVYVALAGAEGGGEGDIPPGDAGFR